MKTFETEQEKFWAGEFGDQYIERNKSAHYLASNTHMFSKVLSYTGMVRSVIEVGANIGMNLIAIKHLLPEAELSAIEINDKAVGHLRDLKFLKVYPESILNFHPDYQRDLVLIKGVLIHMHPDKLNDVYRLLYETSSRYVCVAEYYNPTPAELPYRGHQGRLFKRDFAGELLDRYKDLRLVAYDFVYHRDILFPQDDITWFLLEKR